MKPDFPEDPASVVRSQRKAWIAELEVLSRDPRVRKFTELRQKIELADAWYRLGSHGQGGIGGNQTRLGIPADELSAFKTDDLEDLVLRIPATRLGGAMVDFLEELSFESYAQAIQLNLFG